MPAKVLTEAAVLRLKPGPERREIGDARATGLYLVIQPSGAKSWAMRFRRPGGAKAKLTLGAACFAGQELKGAPVVGQPLTLQAARALAADVNRQRAMGLDVIAEHAAARHRRRVDSEQAGASTFAVLARQFIEEHGKPNVRRWREVARVLGLDYPLDGGEPTETAGGLVQRWVNKPVGEIDGHDIYQVIDEARRYGMPGRERRTKGLSDPRGRSMARTVSKLFAWLVEHRKVAINPCLGMYCPPPPPSRERTLSADEVRWFWRACDAVGYPFGPLCKLLLLVGARREEVRAVTRAELSDGALWTIPGQRTKNHRAHQLLLPPLAREIMAAMPRIESKPGFVFTTNGDKPIGGFSKYKRRLDFAMLAAASKERGKDVTVERWTLHDLRRSCATGMADIGIPPHIIEAVLNHVSGHKASVAGVYNRAQYAEEKRAALERWSAHVQGLVSGAPSKVVTLRKQGA
jgi:integrase